MRFAVAAALVVPAALMRRSFAPRFYKPPRIIRGSSDKNGGCFFFPFSLVRSVADLPAGPICGFLDKHFGEPPANDGVLETIGALGYNDSSAINDQVNRIGQMLRHIVCNAAPEQFGHRGAL